MSLWLKTLQGSLCAKVPSNGDLPRKADVVVIGGGLSGVSVAYFLSSVYNRKVCLLERGDTLAFGASGRNGGHLWRGIGPEWPAIVDRFGLEDALKMQRFETQCVKEMMGFIREKGIECDLHECGSVWTSLTESEDSHLSSCLDTYLQQCTEEQAHSSWDAQTSDMRGFHGGVFNKDAATVHPANLVYGIAAEAIKYGACIHTNAVVTSTDKEDDVFHVRLSDGRTVAAKHVVHATNAWVSKLVPAMEGLVYPVRNQVVSARCKPGSLPHGVCFDRGYVYGMQRLDGRLVWGGCRYVAPNMDTGVDELTLHAAVSEELRNVLKRHVPSALSDWSEELEWAGIMGFSIDEQPFVGPLQLAAEQSRMDEDSGSEWIIAGFTGHGMPRCFLCAKALAAMICHDDSTSDLLPNCYRSSRILKLKAGTV